MDIVLAAPLFFYESGPVGAATLHYDANNTYTLSTTRTGTYEIDFPAFCVRATGAKDDKPAITDPMGPPVDVCKQLEASLQPAATSMVYYHNLTCDPSSIDSGGCTCLFDVADVQDNAGTFQRVDKSTLLHLPGTNFPEKVTYCSKGDRLQLTGANGAYLFDRPGLRTFDLVRAP
jgi:hypothetical protein